MKIQIIFIKKTKIINNGVIIYHCLLTKPIFIRFNGFEMRIMVFLWFYILEKSVFLSPFENFVPTLLKLLITSGLK
jgi:hypothetical protein